MNPKGQNSLPFLRKRLGNFTLLETIGEDPAGAIYRARAEDSGNLVIFRILDPAFSNDRTYRDQFYTLIRVVTELRHPNLATVLHGGESEENFFVASENHKGESLADWIAREDKLPEKTAVGTALCTANALAYVWNTAQLFHGNLAPNRIFVDDNGDVKLFDLALPEHSDPSSRFSSPEILRSDPDADCRADIFSLGLILYNAVTAQTPFNIAALKTRSAILDTEQLPDPRQFAPETSDAFCRVLQKMLARNPSDRFADWQQVETALGDIIANTAPAVAPVPSRKSVLRLNEKKNADSHAAVVHLSLAAVPTVAGAKPSSKPAVPIVLSTPEGSPESPPKKSTLISTFAIVAAVAVIVLAAVWLINTYRFQQITQVQPTVPPPLSPQVEPPVEPPPNAVVNPQPPPLPPENPNPQNNRRRQARGFQDDDGKRREEALRRAGNLLNVFNNILGDGGQPPQNPPAQPDANLPKLPTPEEIKKGEEEAHLTAERVAQQQQERARLAAAFNKFATGYLNALSHRNYNGALELARAAAADPALETRRTQIEQSIQTAQQLGEFLKSLSERLTRIKGRSITWGGANGVVTEVTKSEVVLAISRATVAIPIGDATTEEILAVTTPLPTSTSAEPWLNVAWFSLAEGKPAAARALLESARENGVATDAVTLLMAMLSTEFAEIEADLLLTQLSESIRADKLAISRVILDKLKDFFAHTRTFRSALESLRSAEAIISFHEGFAASPANNVFLTLQNPDIITALAFSADGRHIVAASDNKLRIWELATGRIVRELTSTDVKIPNITLVALSPNNRFVFAKSLQQFVLWDVGASKTVGSPQGHIADAVFSPDGKFLAFIKAGVSEVRLFNLATQEVERVLKSNSAGHQMQNLAISADSRYIASLSKDRVLQIFNAASGKPIRNVTLPSTFNAYSIALPVDAKTLLISADTFLRVFDAETGKEIRFFKGRATPTIRTAYSPDARFALAVHDKHRMTLVDAVTGNEWRAVDPKKIPIGSVALSPDRRLAITASDKTIQVWKLWETETSPTADSKEAAAPK